MSTCGDHGHEDPDDPSDANTGIERAVIQAARNRLVIAIIVGLSGAIVGIIGHHIFLSYLNGHPAEAQFWIKTASNAFSQVVGLFLGLAASALLTQAVWKSLIPDYTQIKIIDDLLSLPSPLSAFGISQHLTSQSMLPLVITLLIHSLLLVGVLAPNSLAIESWTNTTALVPVLDFFYRIPNLEYLSGDDTYYPIDAFILSRLEDYWDPPGGCEIGCSIQVQYQAPALTCRKLRADEIELGAPNIAKNFWYFYTGGYDVVYSDNWGNPYPEIRINYLGSHSEVINRALLVINQTAPAEGVKCNFTDANYQATFGLANGIKSIQTTLISYSQGPVQGCEWASTQSTSFSNCGNYSYNAFKISYYFAQDLTEADGWEYYEEWKAVRRVLGPIIPTYFNVTNVTFTDTTASLSTPVPDFYRVLEQLYSNVTLAAILSTGTTETGTILASNGKQVWTYAPLTLWVTYGVALALILLFTVYGLYPNFNQGIAMSGIFLSTLISMRNKSLDNLGSMDNKTLMAAEIRFNASQVWFDPQEPGTVSQRLLQDENGTLVHSPNTMGLENPNSMSQLPQLAITKPNRWTRLIIIAAYLIGIVLSVAHYLFLRYLNKHDVSQYSQFWIKNASNAFAQAAALSLGLVTSYSLTQAIWMAISTSTPILVINRLFALPAPEAYFQLMISPWRLKLIPTVLIVLTSYSLTLVSIFAPNALIIGTSSQRPTSVTIPTFNYSQIVNFNPIFADSGALLGSFGSKPAGCGPACEFQFEFEAVGLSCSDFHFNDTILSTFDGESWSFITTNSTPGHRDIPDGSNLWGLNDSDFTFWVKFFPSTIQIPDSSNDPLVETTGTPTGSLCRFQGVTYRANFIFSNNTVAPSIKLLHYNNSYSHMCPLSGHTEPGAHCDNYLYWTNSIISKFKEEAFSFNGVLISGWYQEPTLIFRNIVNFYNNVTGDGILSFELRNLNISDALVDLYSNYTLGILSSVPYVQTVNATTWGEIIWKFDVATLWYTYIPAHVLMLVVLAYGFHCMHRNGVLDQEFSTLMMATKSVGLGDLVDNTASYDALMKVKLRHEGVACLAVVDDHLMEKK